MVTDPADDETTKDPKPVEEPAESAARDATAERDEIRELLLLCTEPKRLERARKERSRVRLAIDGPDLYIGAVSAYNVVVDLATRRIQHGCRDFLGQAREGKLCKHVAGMLLAIDPEVGLGLVRELTDPDGGWHLEVIAARGFGRSE